MDRGAPRSCGPPYNKSKGSASQRSGSGTAVNAGSELLIFVLKVAHSRDFKSVQLGVSVVGHGAKTANDILDIINRKEISMPDHYLESQ
jgi:hypothetical protein